MAETAEGASTVVEISPLEQKIIHQIEYYFGDLNLPKDKFLQEEVKKDKGWVTIETLCKFNRLKSLTTDSNVIADAMRKSQNGIVELDEESKKIRRLKALPENSLEYWHDVKSRTVYVKRFPDTITLDELQEFFKNYSSNVEKVQMRFYKTAEQRNFKGSVFITFPSQDEAKKFVALESVKYGEEELVRMLQEQYFKAKSEEAKKRKDGRKGGAKNGNQHEDEKDGEEKEKDTKYTAGRVIRLTGIPKDGVKVEDIRALFKEHQDPEWVEFKRGDEQAYARFENKPNSAEEILKKTLEGKEDGKLMLGSEEEKKEITVAVVTGDEEKEYWQRTVLAIREAREQKNAGSRRGRGGKGGKWQSGRGGKGGRGRGKDGRGAGFVQPQGRKKRFSSSDESDAEGKAKQELNKSAAKRPIESTGAEGEDAPTKKAKTEIDA